MKKYLFVVMLLIVAVVIGALPGCSSDGKGTGVPSPLALAHDLGSGSLIWSQQSVGLWVSADGKVTAAPDIALLTLGVESQEVSVSGAQRKAAEAMDKVMKALKGKGIAD
ncbi:MAG TPA: SIMPL domain-containing protein, partial [Dehalococcoidia bacterium]|nr:SIMPL domain-containing protein [Dehalococcoidia bacterium]